MTLIYFVLILGITVCIHEFGHFIFAKKAGIYVYEFSIGMGPKIYSFRRKNDETIYSLRLIPLGGYVQMAGEEVEPDKDIPSNRRVQSKTWIQRFLTIVAGPIMNFILAIILLFIIGLCYGVTETRPIIGSVVEDYPFSEAGIKPGDKIISINGKKIATWDEALLDLELTDKKEEVSFIIESNGTINEYQINAKEEDGNLYYGFSASTEKEYGLVAALKYTGIKFVTLLKTMVMVFKSLFTGVIGMDSLSGPVGIYSVIGESAKNGLSSLLYITAFISLNVGFVNLIPFPAFDGGRILFLIIEKIKRGPINPKVENIIHSVGFILLLLLMIYVTLQDVLRLF